MNSFNKSTLRDSHSGFNPRDLWQYVFSSVSNLACASPGRIRGSRWVSVRLRQKKKRSSWPKWNAEVIDIPVSFLLTCQNHVFSFFSPPMLLGGCFLCVVWFHLASTDLWREDSSVFVKLLSRPAVPYCTVFTWACTRVSQVYVYIFTYDVVGFEVMQGNIFNSRRINPNKCKVMSFNKSKPP